MKPTRIALTLSLVAFVSLGTRGIVAQNSDARLKARIDSLEAGIRAEEAVRAVKRLQHTYSHYIESGLWNDVADLFADNAVGRFQDETVTGKAGLREYFMKQAQRTSLGLAKGQLNVHLTLQPIITLGADGKTAKGTWHEVAMLGRFGTSATWRGGIFENEYVLDGTVWKISRIHYYPEYSGEYEEWGHKAPPRWNVPYHFESAHVGVTIPASALESLSPTNSNIPAATRMDRLAQRVDRLIDETAVQNLQHIYGYYLDRKMWDDVVDLFTDDGTFETGQQGVYEGKPHIKRALEALYGPSPLRRGELFDHIQLAAVVTITPDGRNASARTTQLSMLGLDGEYARWEQGTYESEFQKRDGIWRIQAVHYYPKMVADYDKGWARDAKPAAAASTEFPPDRKSAQSFESYPEIHYVAFHYDNPVTGKPAQYPAGPITKVKVVPASASTSATGRVDSRTNVETMIEGLEARLNAAIAVEAVENLNSSYGYYIDESAWDAMADTFAITGGAKELMDNGVYVGQDRIRKALNMRGPQGGRSTTFFTIHQLTQPVIHISDDGKSAKVRLRLFQLGGSANGSSGSWIGGIYENTAVKENGEWKFGVQDLYHIFNASYRNGWAKMPSTRAATTPARPSRLATEFPPDRPIRSRQYPFPEIVEPAFHYRNPVTGRTPGDLLQ